jgi:hypothetical protein
MRRRGYDRALAANAAPYLNNYTRIASLLTTNANRQMVLKSTKATHLLKPLRAHPADAGLRVQIILDPVQA